MEVVMNEFRIIGTVLTLLLASATGGLAQWKPQPVPLTTPWAADVRPDSPLPEYPRPQLVRTEWSNLNGLWDYAITPRDRVEPPTEWDGKILVPFPIESSLSGVQKRVAPEQALWYHREFTIPQTPGWAGKDVQLNFGASDWETRVWVNGMTVGEHRGGYDPFSFSISEAVASVKGTSCHLVVRVWDGTDAGYQARGKQVRKPGGIFYTPTTGLWQTVWIEPVGSAYARSLVARTTDLATGQVEFTLDIVTRSGETARTAEFVVRDEDVRQRVESVELEPVANASVPRGATLLRGRATLTLPSRKPWSPESPFLYGLSATILEQGRPIDSVQGYFALRTISTGPDEHNVTRILLNGKPVFQYGPLDQGFWPDGLYTAPTDAALKFDIEMTRKYGFNMIRKHVKVEPARWYYWCDTLGLLVWQDMPSGDRFIGPNAPDIQRTAESAEQFEREWSAIIESLRPFGCIVMWVPFNEGWGQYDTARIVELTRTLDPTRLVNSASGWTDRNVGDVHDLHIYPGPGSPRPTATRAAVLGEFGGLGLPLEGHTWQARENWGYRSFPDQAALTTAYLDLIEHLRPLIGSPGLSAAVYTQTTDVETEVNGLMTYDRRVMKIPVETAAKAHRMLYLPPPTVTVLAPSSQLQAQMWKWTTQAPGTGWQKPEFDDSSWKASPGGFGEKTTPGSVVRTEWKTNDIWLRRTFELKSRPTDDLRFTVHHDEDCEIYLNGILAAKMMGWTTEYRLFRMTPEAIATLKEGPNLLSVHCRQTGGGQYIDVGLLEVQERP